HADRTAEQLVAVARSRGARCDLQALAAIAARRLRGRLCVTDVVPGLLAADGSRRAHAGPGRDPLCASGVSALVRAGNDAARGDRDGDDDCRADLVDPWLVWGPLMRSGEGGGRNPRSG